MTLSEFMALPWSDNVKAKLQEHVDAGDAVAFSARYVEGKLVPRVWAEAPDKWEEPIVVVLQGTASRTEQAIRLMQSMGWTAYRAAKEVGISQAAISRALNRRWARDRCPTCDQPVKKS